MKLKQKLLLSLLATSMIALLILSAYHIFDSIKKNDAEIAEYRAVLLNEFDRNIKNEVNTIHTMVQEIYSQQQKGLITEAEAKKRAADLVRVLRFDNGNYFWIDTVDGTNVVLLGRDAEGKNRLNSVDKKGNSFIKDILANGQKEGGGFTEYWFPKPNQEEPLLKRAYSLVFKPYNWVIGTGNWIDDIDKLVAAQAAEKKQKLMTSIIFIGVISVLSFLLSLALALYVSKRIADPLAAVEKNVQQIAAGNLRVPDLPITSNDEIGLLAKAFNVMKNNLDAVLRTVTNSSDHVADASHNLTESAQQSAQAANQVATAITDVAQGTQLQLSAVSDAADAVAELSHDISVAAERADAVAANAAAAAETAAHGGTSVNRAIRQMQQIEETVNTSALVVSKLGERSKEIGQIVDTIAGIAGQTNLLALNAAIEAARAGEQGRGFAVVAEEVRKLAEQSEEAAKRIASLIKEIQTDTSHAVTAMNNGTHEVKIGAEVVQTAESSFQDISGLVIDVSEQVIEISTAIQKMAAGSQRIVASINTIDGLSRQSAEQAETVSAATEEQSATMDDIAASSRELAKMAEDMQQVVRQFQI